MYAISNKLEKGKLMSSRLIWECKGANKMVVGLKKASLIVLAACSAFFLIVLIYALVEVGWFDQAPLLIICIGALAIFELKEWLQFVTMQNSYLRLFDDHVELLSTSHDAVMKQSWQGVKASVPKEQISKVSVAGKKLVVNAGAETYEVFVPSVDEAEAKMRQYLGR